MNAQDFDVIVIGAGPGGYVAAIKAAQLGMRVACIDKREVPGGVCLNVGCIPSKALLTSSQKFYEAATRFKTHGIYCEGLRFDLAEMMARKEKVVSSFTQGIQYLFRKNNVTFIHGEASLVSPTSLSVKKANQEFQNLSASKIVIATGSAPLKFSHLSFDEKEIVTSTGALSLERVPEQLAIIGGGYIGLEIGSVWQRLGSKVTVIEAMETITPQMDREVSEALLRSLKSLGMTFRLGAKVQEIVPRKKKGGVLITLSSAEGNHEDTLEANVVMVAMGRVPFSEGLGLDRVGIQVDERGVIQINESFQTNIPSIYAIGDVVRGPMLAHKAEEEGVAVAEILAGQKPHINYNAIPAIIYTHPEVASVGKTEEALKMARVPYKVGKFPFTANSRARVNGDTEGFVKILCHQETDEVLGAHILHGEAGNMIAEVVVALEYRASSEDIARICHAHPTLSEAVKEAAMSASFGKAIHI